MLMLVGDTRSKKMVAQLQALGWGRMYAASYHPTPYPGEPWGFDNGAFVCWREGREFDADGFRRRLDRAYQVGTPYMAVCPDVVGGGVASLEFSECWRDELPDDWPWFLAVQDGVQVEDVEPLLGRYAGIFLGGTDAFKHTAPQWADLAHRRGLLFHYGRAGVWRKVRHARNSGADSADSTSMLWDMGKWNWFLKCWHDGHPQKELNL